MSGESDTSTSTILVYSLVFLISVGVAIWAASETDRAGRALEAVGIHDVTIDKGSVLNLTCADEEIAYAARGLNANGERVDVVVCCGAPGSFKGCSVRTK
jgi:hypothetical protein